MNVLKQLPFLNIQVTEKVLTFAAGREVSS